MNPFTKVAYSQKYKKLLAKRKELPAFARMEEFYKMVRMMRTASVYGLALRIGLFSTITFRS